MTAMVDIVFFLLIFFLVTSMASLESVINLPSPKASSSSAATTQPNDYLNDPTFIVVTIDEDDIVYVDDEEVYGDQNLPASCASSARKTPSGPACWWSAIPTPRTARWSACSTLVRTRESRNCCFR